MRPRGFLGRSGGHRANPNLTFSLDPRREAAQRYCAPSSLSVWGIFPLLFRPLRPIVYRRRTPRRFARRGPRLCIVLLLKFSRKDPAGFFVRISRGRTPNFCRAGQGIHFLLAELLPLLRFLWFVAAMWRCDTSGAHSFDGRFGYQAPAYSCCAARLQYRPYLRVAVHWNCAAAGYFLLWSLEDR